MTISGIRSHPTGLLAVGVEFSPVAAGDGHCAAAAIRVVKAQIEPTLRLNLTVRQADGAPIAARRVSVAALMPCAATAAAAA